MKNFLHIQKWGCLLVFVNFSFLVFGQLNLTFQHFVGDDSLQLDSGKYINELNQDFTVSKIKYYIGKVSLINSKGNSTSKSSYFLINEDEKESLSNNRLDVPEGDYVGIEFIIGVDSLENVSGIQNGALDVVNAMFWTWNSGYVFMKLEGNSSFSNQPNHIFEYHIGGFSGENNSVRKIKLIFNSPVKINKGEDVVINLKVDLLEILKHPNSIDFRENSSIVEPSTSFVIANNYSDIFSIISIVK
ncbi:MAG: hypothetical protein HYR91_07470 [Flavobacteriia bacterium]|nr:hypothetical protein [Flavobacteriia bacterium]